MGGAPSCFLTSSLEGKENIMLSSHDKLMNELIVNSKLHNDVVLSIGKGLNQLQEIQYRQNTVSYWVTVNVFILYMHIPTMPTITICLPPTMRAAIDSEVGLSG